MTYSRYCFGSRHHPAERYPPQCKLVRLHPGKTSPAAWGGNKGESGANQNACPPDTDLNLDLTESALRNWLKQSEVDAGQGPPDALTTAEKGELSDLRREVKRLRQERDILKAAATFFAKESE